MTLDTLEGRRLCDWLARINRFICLPSSPKKGGMVVPLSCVEFRNYWVITRNMPTTMIF